MSWSTIRGGLGHQDLQKCKQHLLSATSTRKRLTNGEHLFTQLCDGPLLPIVWAEEKFSVFRSSALLIVTVSMAKA